MKSSEDKKVEEAKLAAQKHEKPPDTVKFEKDFNACEKDEKTMPWAHYGFTREDVENHKHDDERN